MKLHLYAAYHHYMSFKNKPWSRCEMAPAPDAHKEGWHHQYVSVRFRWCSLKTHFPFGFFLPFSQGKKKKKKRDGTEEMAALRKPSGVRRREANSSTLQNPPGAGLAMVHCNDNLPLAFTWHRGANSKTAAPASSSAVMTLPACSLLDDASRCACRW